MPLKSGKGKSAFKSNVEELMHKYESSGTIGKIKPKNKKHAQKVALAIAYRTKRGK